ncbi:30S ribosomal protein S6 alpha, chloroplastic isoform X2 [Jatropha curcas]|uniref:30S ribosomal protein S6 alpha, chloroplastic isoform X2 n=1 Tax=Jatropha curcas TaxID=180498 RepID=UPI001893C654|nr:30S ribosomal protein S6 alpha, chloroplastic isoform X2 [Jatropha curcas]
MTSMASSSSLVSTLINSSPFCPKSFSEFPSLSFTLKLFPAANSKALLFQKRNGGITVKAQTLDFSGSFYEGGGFGSSEDPPSSTDSGLTAVEDAEAPQCPPGLRQYETMAVLRPDMSEDERLALTQKYEEILKCDTLMVEGAKLGSTPKPHRGKLLQKIFCLLGLRLSYFCI